MEKYASVLGMEKAMEKLMESLILLSYKSTLNLRLTTTLPQLLPHHGDPTHFTTAFTTGGSS